jgi:hypothetical protein
MIGAAFRRCKKSVTVLATRVKTVVLSSYNIMKQAKCLWEEATKTPV